MWQYFIHFRNDGIFPWWCLLQENIVNVWCAYAPGWTSKFSTFWNKALPNPRNTDKNMMIIWCCAKVMLMSVFLLQLTCIMFKNQIAILFQHILFSGQILYSSIKPWTRSYFILYNVDMLRAVAGEPADTGQCLVTQPYTASHGWRKFTIWGMN